ncbi:MAG: hypothetical protein ACT4QF_11050 [Sporichthyaceae bacterium]
MSAAGLAGRATLVAALAATLVPVLGAGPAMACSCAGGSDRENYERADVVFKATLRRTIAPTAEQSRRFGTAAQEIFEFAPSRVYKGEVDSPQRVSTAESGATCGLEISGEGPFLVFAYRKPFPGEREADGPNSPNLRAGLCGGTRELGPKEKVPFGPGTPVKSEPDPDRAAPEAPATPKAAATVPAEVALPAVGVLLGLTVGAAAWATRTHPGFSRRRP